MILEPSHVLGPALLHKGTRLIILSLLSRASGMEIAARLLWGTRTNIYFKYEQGTGSKVDFSHLTFRGERGAVLIKDSVAFNSE